MGEERADSRLDPGRVRGGHTGGSAAVARRAARRRAVPSCGGRAKAVISSSFPRLHRADRAHRQRVRGTPRAFPEPGFGASRLPGHLWFRRVTPRGTLRPLLGDRPEGPRLGTPRRRCGRRQRRRGSCLHSRGRVAGSGTTRERGSDVCGARALAALVMLLSWEETSGDLFTLASAGCRVRDRSTRKA